METSTTKRSWTCRESNSETFSTDLLYTREDYRQAKEGPSQSTVYSAFLQDDEVDGQPSNSVRSSRTEMHWKEEATAKKSVQTSNGIGHYRLLFEFNFTCSFFFFRKKNSITLECALDGMGYLLLAGCLAYNGI